MIFVPWRYREFRPVPGDAIGPFVGAGGARQKIERVIARFHRFHEVVGCDRELGNIIVEEFREHLVGDFGLVDPIGVQCDLVSGPFVRV